MKKLFTCALIACAFLLASCTHVKEIGKVNMISNRNIDYSAKYKMISSYAGGSTSELKRSRAKTIQEAVDNTVKATPGGEYLMNATLFHVMRGKSIYFACQGDVWGLNTEVTFRGFRKGDKVIFKNPSFNLLSKKGTKEKLQGTIISLKNDKLCLVEDENNKTQELYYDEITKIQ